MPRSLKKRIARTIPIVAVVPLLLHASLPIEDWSVGVGVGMVCVMCVLGLHAIWTRPDEVVDGDAAVDDEPVAARWTGVREDRRRRR
jgi:hypothetical protein